MQRMDLSFLMRQQGLEVWWSDTRADDAVLGQFESAEGSVLSAWLFGDSLTGELPMPGQRVSVRVPSARGLAVLSGLVLPDDADGLTRIALNGTLRQLRNRHFSRVAMGLRPAAAQLLDTEGQPS